MSRKPIQTAEGAIEHLREFVIKKTGLPCNDFHDVQQLQYQIKRDTAENLSVQTLNRFFGLIKNQFKPSSATLNILSRFIGYKSFGEFEMLSHCSLENSDNHIIPTFLAALFCNVDFKTLDEEGLHNVTKNIFKLVEAKPSILSDIYPLMATSKYGRRYFFEHFVFMDALNEYYGNGLYHYLLHAKFAEQKVFANALLCKRYLLSGNYELFNRSYLEILVYSPAEVKSFHPYVVGSYYAVKLYNSMFDNQDISIADEALTVFSKLSKHSVAYGFFPWAEYVLGDALLLAEDYYQAWNVLESGSLNFNPSASLDQGFETQYELLHLYAGFFSGMIQAPKAVEQLKIINTKPLFFLQKKYYSFYRLILNKILLPKNKSKNFSIQVKNLIQETGFNYFEKIIVKIDSSFSLMEIKGKHRRKKKLELAHSTLNAKPVLTPLL